MVESVDGWLLFYLLVVVVLADQTVLNFDISSSCYYSKMGIYVNVRTIV